MDFNIDMKKAAEESKQFDVLAKGTYKMRCESAEDVQSSKGTAGVHFKFKTLDTEVERTVNYFLYQSSMFDTIIFNMANCFGIAKPKSTGDFVGKIGMIKVTHRKDADGDDQADINPFKGFLVKSEEEKCQVEEVTTPTDKETPF